MKLRVFELERWQSAYEHQVEYNLAESGVHPLTSEEIGVSQDEFFRCRLTYSQTNGTERLRSLAAALYPGATERNVLATIGGAEANFLSVLRLIEPGDEAVLVLPNYMQIHGLIESLGGKVVPVWLRPERKWIPDPEEIAAKTNSKTKLIALSNPNNPTGATFGQDIIGTIADIAGRWGCWILADEVYRGAERDGVRTPSFWRGYARSLVTHSLSKAYGAPGLRLGWVIGPAETIQELWGMADYTRIAPATLSDLIGCRVLEQGERILARTRGILNRNWPVVAEWFAHRSGMFECVEPRAGAICFARYRFNMNSSFLAERLRSEKSTLVVPGDHFLLDGYLRLGFGTETEYLKNALARIYQLLERLC